jgi:hypothetical protein
MAYANSPRERHTGELRNRRYNPVHALQRDNWRR